MPVTLTQTQLQIVEFVYTHNTAGRHALIDGFHRRARMALYDKGLIVTDDSGHTQLTPAGRQAYAQHCASEPVSSELIGALHQTNGTCPAS